ncbi:hypothetical protein ACX1H4_19930 [Yersinia enterocolitica]|uniref:hypothetical protein n=1 Tax=Yersinia enterocolitica TaxID=630 RepID=UPI001C8D3896|nr:hypothetical protein [Yersinia enterocolitica]EKN4180497.1 hypothetical protein [Yersinia enterocolitica]MBX9487379.1 hypothetical protein [Yersinia enterocolitica]MBX9490709.1 hypothetical protein [Yersinia enterocolitica]HEN3447324.1 hypothetical protein [Yersinia enterocolitica]
MIIDNPSYLEIAANVLQEATINMLRSDSKLKDQGRKILACWALNQPEGLLILETKRDNDALYHGDQSAGAGDRGSVGQYGPSVERDREVATGRSVNVPTNFVISSDLNVGDGGPKAKFRDNVAAIT